MGWRRVLLDGGRGGQFWPGNQHNSCKKREETHTTRFDIIIIFNLLQLGIIIIREHY